MMDGLVEHSAIAYHFAETFKVACTPNSESKHDDFNSLFAQRLTTYTVDEIGGLWITIDDVENACNSLKLGKAAGIDGLTADHVVHSHPLLHYLLSVLFTLCRMFNYVPDAFGCGIVVPLLKNTDSDPTNSDNYRGITVSCILSKFFELVLLNYFLLYLTRTI